LTFDEVVDAINLTEHNVRSTVPAARMIYIEPDLHTVGYVDSENRTPESGSDTH
jgi:hypothetical protein